MASIQSLGVGSGLLTSKLVDDIIKAERDSTDLRLETKRALVQAKVSALGSVKATLDKLRSAAGSINSASSFLKSTAESSRPNLLTATGSSLAEPGIHTVEVSNLARAHTLVSGGFSSADAVVGTGTLAIRFGTTTLDGGGAYDTFTVNADRAPVSVTIDESNNTLAGLRDKINSAGIGVNANVVFDGTSYRLVVTSADTGAANSLEITATEGGLPGLSSFNYNATTSNLTQNVAAEDAALTVNGIPITRSSNSVTGVIQGVTLSLLDEQVGSPATVTISRDTADVTDKIQSFVDAYNEAKGLADALTGYDVESKTGGLLIGDASMRTVMRQLRATINGAVSNVANSTVRALVDVGVKTGQDNRLSFDSLKFLQALQSDPKSIASLFAITSRATDSQINVLGAGRAQAGTYDVQIMRQAVGARLAGATVAALANPITIDADNDALTLSVNGTTSGAITLTQGSYADGAALATELQTKINADTVLKAKGASVTVSFNTTSNRLEIRTDKVGSNAKVGIVAVDTNTTAQFGLSVVPADDNIGVDIAGSIGGTPAAGSGRNLAVAAGAQSALASVYYGSPVDGFAAPFVIGATNSSFQIKLDGVTSGTVNITQQSYADGASLAAELKTQINADSALASAGKRIDVKYDAASRTFTFTSDRKGKDSLVEFLTVSTDTATALGIAVGAGVPGRDGGSTAALTAGLEISVLGGDVGARGQVTVVRGVMDKIKATLDTALGSQGSITGRLGGLDKQIAKINEEAARFNARMTTLQERLRTQFASADALISKLQNTQSFLTQQIDSLPGYAPRQR